MTGQAIRERAITGYPEVMKAMPEGSIFGPKAVMNGSKPN